MADPPPAPDDQPDESEVPIPRPTVPDRLSLPLFFPDGALADCLVKLPGPRVNNNASSEGGAGNEDAADASKGDAAEDADKKEATEEPKGPVREWKCHKVVLCAASDFFYERFVIDPQVGAVAGTTTTENETDPAAATEATQPGDSNPDSSSSSTITIPDLPDDAFVREQIDLETAIPLCLEYCYSNQDWESLLSGPSDDASEGALIQDGPSTSKTRSFDPPSLFAAASLLKLKSLISHSLTYIEAHSLDLDSCCSLFYLATLLGPGDRNPGAQELLNMTRAFILDHFCELGDDDLALLAKLPIETAILPLLQADELAISAEKEVYDLVNKILRSRVGTREEQEFVMDRMKLSDATSFVNQPVLWEIVVVENGII